MKRPKRFWLSFLACAIACGVVILIRRMNSEAELSKWRAEAATRGLLVVVETVSVIPAFEDHWFAKRIAGRHHAIVWIDDRQNAADILEMPECPVQHTISIGPLLPEDAGNVLRQRFGSAVRGPEL